MITCDMRPSDALLKHLGKLGQVDPRKAINLKAAMDDLMSVDVFANLLDEAIGKTITTDGRMDLKEIAAFVLRRMKDNQK
jgi:hypothetical protein